MIVGYGKEVSWIERIILVGFAPGLYGHVPGKPLLEDACA
jgi:hypothetical protein